jgi:predicted RNase H-like HicB family nuclease
VAKDESVKGIVVSLRGTRRRHDFERIKAGHIIKAETNQREDEKARGDSPVTYHVLLIDGEGDWITAEVPALPGCVSQGRTREEALSNIREAITAYLESLRARGRPIPEDVPILEVTTVTVELAEVVQ